MGIEKNVWGVLKEKCGGGYVDKLGEYGFEDEKIFGDCWKKRG